MPGKSVGTNGINDLLEVRFLSAERFGLNIIQEILQDDMAIHNAIMTDMVSTFADVTEEIQGLYGAGNDIRGAQVDEFARVATQKNTAGSAVGWPLRRRQYATDWTADYLNRATPADLAETQLAIQTGHMLDVRSDLQAAIFGATNFTFRDFLVRKFSIGVKRFVNADGAEIPRGPNGETFDPNSHTHYLAVSGLDGTHADSLVSTVTEHHQNGQPKLFINVADEAAWRALPNFQKYIDSRLTLNTAANQPNVRLDPFKTNDRPIGLYGAAEVWVKPWAVASYPLCMDVSPGVKKPLVCRVPKVGPTQGPGIAPNGNIGKGKPQIQLKPTAKIVMVPLQCDYMQSDYGFGVWTRTNGAVLYTGGSSYVDAPTL
jgi:hypothetical protein